MTTGEGIAEVQGDVSAERYCYLAPFQLHQLREIAEPIGDAFDSLGAYLVGSCLTRRDYRDVDVRIILHNDQFRRLFGDDLEQYPGHCTELWMLQTKLLSDHMSRMTGLLVDCQIQSRTWSATHHGLRDALMVPPYLPARRDAP